MDEKTTQEQAVIANLVDAGCDRELIEKFMEALKNRQTEAGLSLPAKHRFWEDFQAADYLSLRDDVDRSKIGMIGICGWGGLALNAAALNTRIKATAASTIVPEAALTRAMLVTILWRQAEKPAVNYLMRFSDVPEGQWYSEAVRWAASEKLVAGYGDGRFGANDPITRTPLPICCRWSGRNVCGGSMTGWSRVWSESNLWSSPTAPAFW